MLKNDFNIHLNLETNVHFIIGSGVLYTWTPDTSNPTVTYNTTLMTWSHNYTTKGLKNITVVGDNIISQKVGSSIN